MTDVPAASLLHSCATCKAIVERLHGKRQCGERGDKAQGVSQGIMAHLAMHGSLYIYMACMVYTEE